MAPQLRIVADDGPPVQRFRVRVLRDGEIVSESLCGCWHETGLDA